jgi:hypothetical protein
MKALGNDTMSALLKKALVGEQAALDDARDKALTGALDLDAIGDLNKGAEANRDGMQTSLKRVVENLQKQRAVVTDSTDAWNHYYDKMQAAANRSSDSVAPASVTGAGLASRPVAPSQSSPSVMPPQPVSSSPASPRISTPGYAGEWTLPPSGGASAGKVQMSDARLSLQESGGNIQGTLYLTYDGENGITKVAIKMSGPVRPGKTVLNWSNADGSFDQGQIELSAEEGFMLATITKSSNPRIPAMVTFGLVRTR